MGRIRNISLILCLHLLILEGIAQSAVLNDFPDSLNKKRLNIVLVSGFTTYVAGLSFLSFYWYKNHERVPFHFYDDSKGYLQMDKASHAFIAYHASNFSYNALRWAGLDKRKALIYGAPVGLVLLAPIEIYDGLYEGWGFSWSDLIANAAGTTLFTVQEAFFDEQIFLMKISYSPSGYPKYHHILGETPLENFIYDYNGSTYWISGNLKRITGIQKIPGWLNFACGYSANGMIKEFNNPDFYLGEPFPYIPRYRQYIFSLDIDFTRIPTKRKWLRPVFRCANLIKVPFPALEINQVDGVRFRPFYF